MGGTGGDTEPKMTQKNNLSNKTNNMALNYNSKYKISI